MSFICYSLDWVLVLQRGVLYYHYAYYLRWPLPGMTCCVCYIYCSIVFWWASTSWGSGVCGYMPIHWRIWQQSRLVGGGFTIYNSRAVIKRSCMHFLCILALRHLYSTWDFDNKQFLWCTLCEYWHVATLCTSYEYCYAVILGNLLDLVLHTFMCSQFLRFVYQPFFFEKQIFFVLRSQLEKKK